MLSKRVLLAASFFIISIGSDSLAAGLPFNPREYPKKVVTCAALNRAENKQVDIDLRMSHNFLGYCRKCIKNTVDYVDINPKAEKTLLLLHGWPSLWASWKYQIQEFQDDYHIIAPDLRGFGASMHPGDVRSSGSWPDLVGDLLCILGDAGVSKTIAVGHDWGTQLAYEAARERPDVFTAVVGITIPYVPAAGPFMSTQVQVAAHPRLAYQLFFDKQTPAAVAELESDIRRTLRGTLRDVASPPPESFLASPDTFLGAWDNVKEIPVIPFFSEDEEDYWVEQFRINGFKYNLQYYTEENRFASWKFANEQGNHTIPQPVLSILPTEDPVANMELAAKLLHSFDFLPNHTLRTLPTAHWTHLEKPIEVNSIIRKWLTELDTNQGQGHVRDEL
ncbi:alpha/beta-hydrolase [Multifurca ochricompacta]|uniref:Alpha/beta-hydrolase n=1 Tax=Multifurca ochricompacta TaxID=376703 RepID=A0AAD4M4Q6_9AGAM|nr:alpha/beta-hydrolase [Multifurca ochricompacta]